MKKTIYTPENTGSSRQSSQGLWMHVSVKTGVISISKSLRDLVTYKVVFTELEDEDGTKSIYIDAGTAGFKLRKLSRDNREHYGFNSTTIARLLAKRNGRLRVAAAKTDDGYFIFPQETDN